MIKTVIGSFDSYDEAQRVVRDLKDDGFMADDVSIVASDVAGHSQATDADRVVADGDGVRTAHTDPDRSGAATGAVTGGVVGGAAGLAVSLMGLAIPGIGPIIAAGPIVAALTGAGVGAVAGGLIGGLTDLGVDEKDAEYYAEAVRRGGALVTVRADESRAGNAADIMRRHGAVDIERRVETWRQTGWSGFDHQAQPYSSEEIGRERDSWRAAPGSTAGAGSTRVYEQRAASGHFSAGAAGLGSSSMGSSAGMNSAAGGGNAASGYNAGSSSSFGATSDRGTSAGMGSSGAGNADSGNGESQLGVSSRTGSTANVPGGGLGTASAGTGRSAGIAAAGNSSPERSGSGSYAGSGAAMAAAGDGGLSGGRPRTSAEWDTYEDDFRSDYETNYASRGGTFDEYAPAYRYGLDSASSYRGRPWDDIEPNLQRDWERDNPGREWAQFKNAARRGWQRMSDAIERAVPGDSDHDGK
ncbi:MAG: general stress protein [Casimicrobiaceae bacterium]